MSTSCHPGASTKAKKHHTMQLRKLINAWIPLVRSEVELNQDLHHRAHLAVLIKTTLSGKYPL
jgi:uncharacterized protein YjiS (DUF1127 family)